MIIESTINFFRTGELVNIPLGTEKRMVINLLGKTGEKIESRESSMLKYDRTEFYFYHHESGLKYLNGIVIQPIPISADKGNLRMNYYWLNKKLKYHSAKNQLKLENINFIEVADKDNDSLKLKTESGVEFLFFREDNYICKVGSYLEFEKLDKIINCYQHTV